MDPLPRRPGWFAVPLTTAGLVVLCALLASGWLYSWYESARRDAEVRRLLEANEELRLRLLDRGARPWPEDGLRDGGARLERLRGKGP